MTNAEILQTEVTLRGITEEVHTYQEWKYRGQQVQRGAKALFDTRIWKPVRNKDENGEYTEGTHMIMVKAFFFGASQVAPAQA